MNNKDNRIKSTSSPKMFYTPDELENYNTDIPRIQLAFNSFLYIDMNNNLSMKRTTLSYTKIIIRNGRYDFVFVQDEQIELFYKMYLQENNERNSYENRIRS